MAKPVGIASNFDQPYLTKFSIDQEREGHFKKLPVQDSENGKSTIG